MSWMSWLFPPGRDRVLGMNRRNVDYVLPRNPRRHFDIANDKLRAKRLLAESGVAVAETLEVFASFREVADVEARLAGLSDFALKPARGSGGRGIVVISHREGRELVTAGGRRLDLGELRRHIADIIFGVYSLDRADVALVEPRLVPHPFFANLFATGLSDIRIIVVDNVPVVSMIRVPTRASDGKANLHAGGLGLAVDLDTGEVGRALWKGRRVTTHPDNDQPVVGLCVPQWPELVALAVRASQAVPLDFLGVDLAVDARLGPVVLEINVRPGLEIQNVTGVPLVERIAERLG